jgi:hypothetical protein
MERSTLRGKVHLIYKERYTGKSCDARDPGWQGRVPMWFRCGIQGGASFLEVGIAVVADAVMKRKL